jgi:cellobiose dehydrogenase (acceptor)
VTAFRENQSDRYHSEHAAPPVYSGDAKLIPIKSGTFVNSTHISYTFLCSKCIMPANNFTFNPNSDSARLAWARSDRKLSDTSLSSTPLTVHSEFGYNVITLAGAKSAKYDTWAAMAGI